MFGLGSGGKASLLKQIRTLHLAFSCGSMLTQNAKFRNSVCKALLYIFNHTTKTDSDLGISDTILK